LPTRFMPSSQDCTIDNVLVLPQFM